jgi:hypothetical protein
MFMPSVKLFRIAILFLLFVPIDSAFSQNSKPTIPPVKIDIPRPSPQQFPNSSVFPAGSGGMSTTVPSESSKQSANSHAARTGELIVAPIPFSNEAFSFGLVPFVQYVFHADKTDRNVPQSSIVLTGLLATRSSWAAGGGGRFYLKQDRYRLSGFGGHGSIGYDTFGVGNDGGDKGEAIAIRQGGDLAVFEFLIRPLGAFYIGPRFNYRNLSAGLDSERTSVTLPPGLDPSDLGMNFSSHSAGVKLQHDTRSDIFYPTAGHQLEFIADFFKATRTSELIQDKDLSYQSYQLSYNQYFSLTPTQILAFRSSLCDVTGDPPFYELCLFGAFSDIRGYQPGRYRDHLMIAVQSEYRKTLGKRWGFVLFGGVGEVAPEWNAFTTEDLLPGGGAGIRLNLSRKQRIHLRADIAYGKAGWSWNFAVGEAF